MFLLSKLINKHYRIRCRKRACVSLHVSTCRPSLERLRNTDCMKHLTTISDCSHTVAFMLCINGVGMPWCVCKSHGLINTVLDN